ncbi:isocitrate lyase/phosphoenolpyruvate mutase family protein [Egibacter rhizosphaerae]|uniref:Isocitrate lyase/phosphoenolpyruvate mutase family protein n=2 Tax=Egibacter rhizosphaerae TaxID=1670831 RepID=A0A411YLB6_9ACTN|nr:isocitrate lyase/phosphoenolpyruvate mutase family protein [Egibacter rhizosphaerae]
MPNAWDVGSAVRFAAMGFPALATTSSGHAMSLGRDDQQVGFDELCAHAASLVAAVDVPVSVDSERLFATTAAGVAANVATLAAAGVAGLSIEDYDPATGAIDPLEPAAERVEAAATTARAHGLVLTARAENHLYGIDDFDDTVHRLDTYRRAGADVAYAPGLTDPERIRTVVTATRAPVNVLLLPDGPDPAELAGLGVRRASTGGRLARIAYDAACSVAGELSAGQGPPERATTEP